MSHQYLCPGLRYFPSCPGLSGLSACSNSRSDALEQIDVATNLINKYSDDFALCKTADEVEYAIREGKIASLFGLEG